MSKKITNDNDYWMGMAFFISAKSLNEDQEEKQGAVIVTQDYSLVHMSCDQSLNNHFIHAELNTLMEASTENSNIMYVTHTPCYSCLLAIFAAGIKHIIYFPTKSLDEKSLDLIHQLQHRGGFKVEEFKGNLNWMRDYLKTLDFS